MLPFRLEFHGFYDGHDKEAAIEAASKAAFEALKAAGAQFLYPPKDPERPTPEEVACMAMLRAALGLNTHVLFTAPQPVNGFYPQVATRKSLQIDVDFMRGTRKSER